MAALARQLVNDRELPFHIEVDSIYYWRTNQEFR